MPVNTFQKQFLSANHLHRYRQVTTKPEHPRENMQEERWKYTNTVKQAL